MSQWRTKRSYLHFFCLLIVHPPWVCGLKELHKQHLILSAHIIMACVLHRCTEVVLSGGRCFAFVGYCVLAVLYGNLLYSIRPDHKGSGDECRRIERGVQLLQGVAACEPFELTLRYVGSKTERAGA